MTKPELTLEQRRHRTAHLPRGPASGLRVLAWVRLISANDLATALSVHPVTGRRYLRGLHHRKLAKRDSYSFADIGGTGWLYRLSALGARTATVMLGHRVAPPKRRTSRSSLVEHRLDTTRALCGLIAAFSQRMVAIETGRSIEAHMQRRAGSHGYIPDAYLAFRMDQDKSPYLRHVFLEVDRATETTAVLEKKLRALHDYYAKGAYRNDFKSERLVVLFTVPTEGRIPAVMNAVRQVRPCVRVFVRQHAECANPETALSGWIDCISSNHVSLSESTAQFEEKFP